MDGMAYCEPMGRDNPLVERIRKILQIRGMTPYDLSQRAGLSDGHVNTMLNRNTTRLSAETLTAIADAADVSLEWLVSGRGDPLVRDPSLPPRFYNVPGYADLEPAAKALEPALPLWVWEMTARSRPWLSVPMTPRTIADVAKFIASHCAPGAAKESEDHH
jgi:transcriptional regulator with XRE-family HTH domain